MSLSATAKWVLLALAGLAIAIGVAIAAANLAGQQIGIASESVSAGDSLAPSLSVPAEKPSQQEGEDTSGPGGEETTPVLPAEPPSTGFEETSPPAEEPVEPPGKSEGDDHGGHGSDGDD